MTDQELFERGTPESLLNLSLKAQQSIQNQMIDHAEAGARLSTRLEAVRLVVASGAPAETVVERAEELFQWLWAK